MFLCTWQSRKVYTKIHRREPHPLLYSAPHYARGRFKYMKLYTLLWAKGSMRNTQKSSCKRTLRTTERRSVLELKWKCPWLRAGYSRQNFIYRGGKWRLLCFVFSFLPPSPSRGKGLSKRWRPTQVWERNAFDHSSLMSLPVKLGKHSQDQLVAVKENSFCIGSCCVLSHSSCSCWVVVFSLCLYTRITYSAITSAVLKFASVHSHGFACFPWCCCYIIFLYNICYDNLCA